MAATKLTADGLLSTEETDTTTEDTRMDTDMSYEEEDALLSEDQGEDVGSSNDSVPNAQRQERKKETMNEPKKPEQKTKSLYALTLRATTEAGSAKEKHNQSPPELPAAPIEKDHGTKKS